MHRLVLTLAALVMLFALSATALGASPSQQQCEADGGTFSRPQGTATCTYPPTSDPVGNSPEGGPQQTIDTSQTDDQSQGNLTNQGSPHYEEGVETCEGPGNSTAQCP